MSSVTELLDQYHPVIAGVAFKYRVSSTDILSSSRVPLVCRARAEVTKILREEHKLSWPVIGKILGRDHSALMDLAGVSARRQKTQINTFMDTDLVDRIDAWRANELRFGRDTSRQKFIILAIEAFFKASEEELASHPKEHFYPSVESDQVIGGQCD